MGILLASVEQLLRRPDPRFRRLLMALVLIVPAVIWTVRPEGREQTVELVAWTMLMCGIVAGGYLTGWRAAQFPKSRAADFYLVIPASDWHVVLAIQLAGAVRTVWACLTTWPAVAILLGARWITPCEAAALICVPVVGGWLSGTILATIAYEPLAVRRWLERLTLAGIVLYLLLFGLLGAYFVPWFFSRWATLTGTSPGSWSDPAAPLRYLSPFSFLGGMGTGGASWPQLAAVLGTMLAIVLLASWRLVHRLRPHYDEEHFSRGAWGQQSRTAVGENPLAWWTHRRVSQFRGNINLYLTWGVILLYAGWMLAGDRWPSWLGVRQLQVFERYGGEQLLALVALQLAIVPLAFLNGLWDSDTTQRLRRLELLLVAPLAASQFLTASVVAGWTRGRGYLLAALVMWGATLLAGRLTVGQLMALLIVAAVYVVLSFAVAMRNYARLDSDTSVAGWGLAWSVGIPVVTVLCWLAGWQQVAALSPLGALHVIGLSAAQRVTLFGGDGRAVATVLAGQFCLLLLSLWLLRRYCVCFDHEIRAWYGRQLSGGAEHTKLTGGRRNKPRWLESLRLRRTASARRL